MDFNIKLIENVKQCPALYDNNYTLEDRNQAWLMLADKLQTNEQVLKVRWHYLLQRYQQETNFRYGCRMNFLQDYISTWHVKVHHWPEFVITEEDLKDDGAGEKAEFHYLVEENEETNECHVTKRKEESQNLREEEITNVSPNNHNDEQKNNEEHSAQNSALLKSQNKISSSQKDKQEDEGSADNQKNTTSKPDDVNIEEALVNQTPDKDSENTGLDTVQEETIVELVAESPKEKSKPVKEKSKSSCNERDEDDIFGELVSATLKRMDETKKKGIKKEIMNLLFS